MYLFIHYKEVKNLLTGDIANSAFGYVDQVALMLTGMGSSADVFRMVKPILSFFGLVIGDKFFIVILSEGSHHQNLCEFFQSLIPLPTRLHN